MGAKQCHSCDATWIQWFHKAWHGELSALHGCWACVVMHVSHASAKVAGSRDTQGHNAQSVITGGSVDCHPKSFISNGKSLSRTRKSTCTLFQLFPDSPFFIIVFIVFQKCTGSTRFQAETLQFTWCCIPDPCPSQNQPNMMFFNNILQTSSQHPHESHGCTSCAFWVHSVIHAPVLAHTLFCPSHQAGWWHQISSRRGRNLCDGSKSI